MPQSRRWNRSSQPTPVSIRPILLGFAAPASSHHRKRRKGGAGPKAKSKLALVGLRGDGGTSHDQSRDEGAKESFASASGVVHELEEAEIERQLLRRDAPGWPQPGA